MVYWVFSFTGNESYWGVLQHGCPSFYYGSSSYIFIGTLVDTKPYGSCRNPWTSAPAIERTSFVFLESKSCSHEAMLSTLLARGTERLLAILSGPTSSFSSLPSVSLQIHLHIAPHLTTFDFFGGCLASQSVDVKTGIALPNFPLANLYGQNFTKTIQSILNEDLEYVKRSPYELEPFDQDEVIRNTVGYFIRCTES